MSRPHRFEFRQAHQGAFRKALTPTYLVFATDPEEFIAAATIERGEHHSTRLFDVAGASRDGWVAGKFQTDQVEVGEEAIRPQTYRIDRYGDLRGTHYSTVNSTDRILHWDDLEVARKPNPDIFSLFKSTYDRTIVGYDRKTEWAALHPSWKDSTLGNFTVTESLDDESYRLALVVSITEMLRCRCIERVAKAI